jgi:hypothetical protein
MKKILALLVIAAAAWWYFVGSSRISEGQAVAFYRDYERAMLERKPEDLCALLADDYTGIGTVSAGGQGRTDSADKEQTCENWRQLFASWEKLGAAMGGMLQVNSGFELHSVNVAADHKSAEVDISTTLDVGGSLMHMASRGTDTLVRRHGKVLMLHSEGEATVGAAGQ